MTQFTCSILVVDDEPMVLEFVSEVLESESCVVETATTVSEAIQLLRAKPYHALVCDLRLGPEDGMEIIRCAAKEFPGCRIVAISGFSPQLESYKPLIPSCLYLAKPFLRVDLLQALNLGEAAPEGAGPEPVCGPSQQYSSVVR